MGEDKGGGHSGKPDTAPHDGHRDRTPQVPPIAPDPRKK